MTFSILAGLLGIGTVIWYGLGEMGSIEADKERRKIEKVAAERGVVSRANTGLDGSNALGGHEEITKAA